jgi:RNA polymerase sigma factor (sigma-70 family)
MDDQQFLEHWRKLVHHIAMTATRTYKLRPEDTEDIEGEMILRLLRCPQDKRQYDGYIRQLLNNAVRTAIDSLMARGGGPLAGWRDYSTLSYRQAAPPRDPNAEDEASDADRACGGTPNPERGLVDSITLDSLTARLPERERVAVCGYYGESRTIEEIAVQLGCCVPTVRNLLKAAIHRLRRKSNSFPDKRR